MRPAQRKARKTIVTPTPAYPFHFLGFRDGWYALRNGIVAPDLAALTLENEVTEWLIAQHITIGKWAWLGNGTVYPDRPQLPVPNDGSHFAVLLKRPADVLRFEMRFACLGITPQSMLDALRGEASKPRLTVLDIARLAYDADHRVNTITGFACPSWDDMTQDDRQIIIDEAQDQIAHASRTPEQFHDVWWADRRRRGWRYGPVRDDVLKTHPAMVAFDRLSLAEKVKDQLFVSMVTALVPLLDD